MGLASYYRKFIENFAKKTHHLNRLKSKNIEFNFDERCVERFNEIGKLLSGYPVIAHPDTPKPFILHTDASHQGLGGTLSQIGLDGLEHPVLIIFRSLNPCKKKLFGYRKRTLGSYVEHEKI